MGNGDLRRGDVAENPGHEPRAHILVHGVAQALLGGGGGGHAGHGRAHDDAHPIGRRRRAAGERFGGGAEGILGEGVGIPKELAGQPQVHVGHLGGDAHRQRRGVKPGDLPHGARAAAKPMKEGVHPQSQGRHRPHAGDHDSLCHVRPSCLYKAIFALYNTRYE